MDMSKYTDIFIEETGEHLQKLNQLILQLESDPNAGVLDEIFRSAHTLKGMSATMGYNTMAEFTHQMENLLQFLRSGECNVGSEIVDLLFKCLDQLEKAIADIASGGSGDIKNPEVLDTLANGFPKIWSSKEIKTEEKPIKEEVPKSNVVFNEFESNLISEGNKKGFHTYHVVVHIRPNCIMKSARSYMVFKNLEPIGEVIKTVPSIQDIEDEKFENSFAVILLSQKSPEVVRKVIVSIAEIDEPEISAIKVEEIKVDNMPGVVKKTKVEPPKNKEVSSKISKPSQTVRVDIRKLDNLMNLVGELVINKTRLEQVAKQNPIPELKEALEQTNRLSSDLQNIVMNVRMVPVEQVFNRFPRMVRDLSRELGKDITLYIEGLNTELDRTVIDEIGDPLVHILRNSIDHGIETPAERVKAGKPAMGTINLIARHEGNNVVIEVDDDGKGINPHEIRKKIAEKKILNEDNAFQLEDSEAINFIFHPGFSTADKVTDISGRGVGLDAAKNKIESLSGEIFIESKVGVGTKFKIQLPLTLAIIQALMVQISDEIYSIPLSFISETTSINPKQIKMVQDQEVMLLREMVLPLVRLRDIYRVPGKPLYNDELSVVVVKKGDKKIGLAVDALIGQQEIVIKSLGEDLDNIPGIAGATIFGNGLVSLIVDATSLF